MTQNRHNAIIHLGHQNGVVSLWAPNLPHPAVQLLAHLGPVVSLSVDPSTGGRYMASSGADGTVKVWDCRNWKGAVREWTSRGGGAELEWSVKGALAVATGGSVNVRLCFLFFQTHENDLLCIGVREAIHPNFLRSKSSSAALSYASYPPSAAYFHTILSIPRYSHCRAQYWSFQHTCSWIRRAQLRQHRSRSI